MSSDRGDSSRVTITHHLRKTLHSIREITGKQHSDEDILSVYNDSFHDPHETAQKLLFLDSFPHRWVSSRFLVGISWVIEILPCIGYYMQHLLKVSSPYSLEDTFHEVKSKREKRKENIVPLTQASGRSSRKNFASSNTNQGNGRRASFKRERGANHVIGVSKTVVPATNKARHITEPGARKVSGPTRLPCEDHNVQDDPSLISASRCSNQSDQVTEIETASNKGRTESPPKSDVSKQLHVTFPFHLQAAEVLQNGLTFGSFDSNFVKEASSNNGACGGDDSRTVDDKAESSPTANGFPGVTSVGEEASTFSEDKDSQISNPAPAAELVVHSDHHIDPPVGVLKEEALSNTETQQIAYGQEAPLSVFGLVPSFSALGQPINTEAAETQPGNSNAPAIPLVPYPPVQGSIAAASQQATHLYRPHGIPQQPYLPAGAALTAPSHVNQVGNSENAPTTNPSSHASPMVATHIPSATTLNSNYSAEKALPLSESAVAWIGQGLGNLHVSPMYNLAPQGQPLGFPILQAGHGGLMGIHQPTQPVAAASTTYQTLLPAPHTTTAMAEAIGHPHIASQQHQAAVTNLVKNY